MNNNNFIYQVYRKPTHIGTVISNDLNRPIQHKLGNFHSYLTRSVSVPLTKNILQKDVNTIYKIGES